MVKTAFVFPGQGSQSVGMLSDFVPQYSGVLKTFAEASEAIGYDLWDLIQNGPEERINQTEQTQVVMLASDVAIYRLLRELGVNAPDMMAGHSLGEYAALVAANSLNLADAVRLVAQRGRIMQNAVPIGQGAMAAIVGLTDEEVQHLCDQASNDDQKVTPANFNAIGQVVIAGYTQAVERAIAMAEQAGARLAKIIPVSVPCHCPLLFDAADQFEQSLNETAFKKPEVAVVSNVDVDYYSSPEQIRTRLKEQLYSPVRWVETIQLFKHQGVDLLVECGPGKVLGGLTKRIDRSINTISVYDTISLDQIMEQLGLDARAR